MKKIVKVEVLEDYRLNLKFADETKGIVDVSDLVGRGVFSLWEDYDQFRRVQIGSSGELVWAAQVDLCPDALYLKVTGQQPEDIFPSLSREEAFA